MRRALALSSLLAAGLVMTAAGRSDAAEPAAAVVVTRSGAKAAIAGPDNRFTGRVRVDDAFKGTDGARISGATVTFEPGARTNWHTHPLGHTLIVLAGVGRVRQWGRPIVEIRPGDTVWIPPGVKHWHGATDKNGMTHVAIVEEVDGKTVDWMEPVSDAQFAGP